MNKRFFAILMSLAFSPALADSCLAADPPGVRFRTIDAGFAEARATGKPLLLFFTADWCPACQRLEYEFFRSTHFVKGIEADFVPVRVANRTHEDGRHAPEVQSLLDSTRTDVFPSLVAVHADGIAAVRNVGYSGPGDTVSFLREAVSRLKAAETKKRLAASR